MASPKVGLVVRTVRPSIAEQAIHQVMRDFFSAEDIAYEPVEPHALEPSRYQRLVFTPTGPIGPASLVAGPHVLNAAAISDPASAGRLAEYRYVSVRTSADLGRVGTDPGKVAVVPCVTTRFVDRAVSSPRRDVVGIHFDATSFAASPDWQKALRAFEGLGKLYLPFDPDSAERGALARLMGAVGAGRSVGRKTPSELFEIIGGLRLLVCSSLQAALFAYLQNVPFLLFPVSAHETEYLRDRGLEAWTFRSAEELRRKAPLLLASAPDCRELVEHDRTLVHRHFDLLRASLKGAGAVAVPGELATAPSHGPSYHFTGSPSQPGPRRDSHADHNVRAFLSQLDTELQRLHRHVADQHDAIEDLHERLVSQHVRTRELAGEVDRLQGEIFRREALLDEMRRSRAWRIALRLQSLIAPLRRGLERLRRNPPR